jgi:cytochrome c oxidase subunit IV
MASGHHVNYWLIFLALCVCTALSVVADLIQLDNKFVVAFIVLSIASAKALFVMTYFMHLKFEGAWKFVILAPTAILAVGLMLALLPDIGVHYYPTDVPQNRYPAKADEETNEAQLVPEGPEAEVPPEE